MDYEIIIRFLLAALWGGLVGAEREYRSKSAGFRTMIMISVGACFFTMMSTFIGDAYSPDRIAANIVTGIGFLGAGVIFRGESRVNGITTAATIWAVAAVGMGIGAGKYFTSASASIMILIILVILPWFEKQINYLNQYNTYIIECSFSESAVPLFEQLFKECGLKYSLKGQIKDGDELTLQWGVQGNYKKHQDFIKRALQQSIVKRFEY